MDFLIDRNPKPENRAIQIGIVARADLEGITKPGANFINFKTGIAWSSNGGFITGKKKETSCCVCPFLIPFEGNEALAEKTIPHQPWEHDHSVGVLVDVEKGKGKRGSTISCL